MTPGNVISMLSDRDLMKLACRELVRVFGRKYLQAHYEGTLEGHGMIDDDTFMLFVGIKTDEDLPDHPATDKGWTVHGRAHGQIAKHRLPA